MRKRSIRLIYPEYQDELDSIIKSLLLTYNKGAHLHKIHAHVTGTVRGRAYKTYQFTIPLWAYNRGKDYFTYYTAHELSHILVYIKYRGIESRPHGEEFYIIFRQLCPLEVQHYELEFRPSCKNYGIRENKVINNE